MNKHNVQIPFRQNQYHERKSATRSTTQAKTLRSN